MHCLHCCQSHVCTECVSEFGPSTSSGAMKKYGKGKYIFCPFLATKYLATGAQLSSLLPVRWFTPFHQYCPLQQHVRYIVGVPGSAAKFRSNSSVKCLGSGPLPVVCKPMDSARLVCVYSVAFVYKDVRHRYGQGIPLHLRPSRHNYRSRLTNIKGGP